MYERKGREEREKKFLRLKQIFFCLISFRHPLFIKVIPLRKVTFIEYKTHWKIYSFQTTLFHIYVMTSILIGLESNSLKIDLLFYYMNNIRLINVTLIEISPFKICWYNLGRFLLRSQLSRIIKGLEVVLFA